MAKKAGAGSSHKPGFAAYILAAALIAILISFSGIFNYAVTSMATATSSTRANVSITGYVAIALSNNLSQGIAFGVITLLPANNTNATLNYVNYTGATAGGDLNFTAYNATVSTDSNQNVDFCLKVNTDLTTSGGSSRIGFGNMTWADNTTNNRTHPPGGTGYPSVTFGRNVSQSYVKGEINIATGSADNYRFWLNVTAGQAAGDYNNTVFFRGVTTGDACGT